MRVGTMNDVAMTRSTATGEKRTGEASGHYARFAAMILTSAALMYVLMYLNTYVLEHVYWSTTRLYMTLIMISTMTAVMLSFMLSMFRNRRVNIAIFAGSVFVFVASLVFVRYQTFIGDRAWMEAMIPHHSIAILTSNRAAIADVRARALADRIARDQTREISEIKWLLDDIRRNGIAKTPGEAATRPVPSF